MMEYERYLRRLRLEARLSYRESDRRDPKDVLSWTRHKEPK